MSGTTNDTTATYDLRIRSRASMADEGRYTSTEADERKVNDTARLIELLSAPTVTITGARAATSYGELVAGNFATDLARAGGTLLVGGSYGIEAAAIRAALAAGGNVIVALAGGVDRPYPAPHTSLFDRVLDAGGLVISAEADGAVPSRSRFVARQELVAKLTGAVVIVESSPRSGSLLLAEAAKKTGLPVYAVPGPVTSITSAGPHALLAAGDADLARDLNDLGNLAELTGTPPQHPHS